MESVCEVAANGSPYVSVYFADYAGESSVYISDAAGNTVYSYTGSGYYSSSDYQVLDLAPGTYDVYGGDTANDGWNDSWYYWSSIDIYGDGADLLFNAVSYTHLTLPTIYSV